MVCGLLLDEGLLEQAELFVELAELAFEHLLDDVGGLAGGGSLGAVDVLLALEVGFGDFVLADVARVDRGDVHGDVAEQLLEVFGAGDEVGLAVELEEYADLAAGVDVGADCALVGGARGLLGSRRHAALAQDDEGVFHVALGFLEGLEAVAHGGAGLFAEFLDELGVDFRGFSMCRHNLPSHSMSARVGVNGSLTQKERGAELAPFLGLGHYATVSAVTARTAI